ncbi:hypothetical protein PW52_16775 [Tamlana sedimentorum]|uniref:SRPBCC family protein n=1 Tax=Neotamlana sedimentorum TaxID=1435349 RepID=A0A0D7VWG7_9FLAO|nr:SRPBCC family protein [Tamlana sedimentorum]KJD31196.1 hypothetical protein PW52_16775 [Tamlana sedimentorum]
MNNVNLRTEKGVTIITSEVEINASREKVWKVLSLIGEIEKFHPLVKKSEAISHIKSGLGAKRHCELLPMGQMEEEVVEWREGKSFVLEVVGGKMLPPYRFMKGRIDLVELDEKTKVTFLFSYQLKYGILGRMMNALVIRPQFKKAPPKYVNGLKEYVETLNN